MSAENTAREVVQTLASSEKVAYTVAGSTAITGIVSNLEAVQGWLSICATSFGILLTLILVIKHGIGVIKEWRELRKNDDPK